jgi:hypothetical protein
MQIFRCIAPRCLLSLPTSVVITGIDSMKILDQAFEAVLQRQAPARGEGKASIHGCGAAGLGNRGSGSEGAGTIDQNLSAFSSQGVSTYSCRKAAR